jgi:L-threonylcarbamoyladenylate synthase
MPSLLARRWFLLLLAGGVALAAIAPYSLRPWTASLPPRLIVAAALFLMAWGLETRRLLDSIVRPVPALWGVTISFGVVPALAWLIGLLLAEDHRTGLLIMAAVPCTLASAALWTRMARGNEATALLIIFLTTCTSWLCTTFWLTTATLARVSLDATAMMRELVVVLVVPVALGQLARLRRPWAQWASEHKQVLGTLAQVCILAMILKAAVDLVLRLREGTATWSVATVLVTAAASLGVHLAGLYTGLATSRGLRFDRGSQIAVAFAGSQKTLPVALLLYESYFKESHPLAVVPLVFYHVGQLIVDTFIADRMVHGTPPVVESPMRTEVLSVDAVEPEPGPIARAAAVLRRGGLVAFPTETVYGLGANALDAAAVERIFAAKGRPASNPLIVHVAAPDDAAGVVAAWPETAARLAERFWPGPLTLVLPKGDTVPDVVTAGGPTVAVRLPAHPVAQALIRAAGVPVAAPSANRSGYISPTCAEHVLRGLDGRIDLVLDSGPVPGGLESTVLDLTTAPPRLLRPGLVTPQQIEEVIGPIARPVTAPSGAEGPLPSPGLLTRHYAPRAIVECVPGNGSDRVAALLREGRLVGWLTFDEPADNLLTGANMVLMPPDPAGYAARLYAVLHDLDRAGVERIVVALPPEKEEWLAVRDRLRRAAADEPGPRGE